MVIMVLIVILFFFTVLYIRGVIINE